MSFTCTLHTAGGSDSKPQPKGPHAINRSASSPNRGCGAEAVALRSASPTQTRVYCPTYLIQGGALPLVSAHDIRRGVREAKKINGSLKVEFEGLRLRLQLTGGVEVVVLFMQNGEHEENLHVTTFMQ